VRHCTSDDGIPRIPDYQPIGMYAGGLYAAMAILAALLRARRNGTGALVEVAEADAACAFVGDAIDTSLNALERVDRPTFGESVRYSYYETSDGRIILFQASEAKFWDRFCRGVDRPDLLERFPSAAVGDHARGNDELRRELQAIFRCRTQVERVQFLLEHDVPGGPVNEASTVASDAHFRARHLVYESEDVTGTLRLFGTPVKIGGEVFSARPAPALGEHSAAVLREVWQLTEDDLEQVAGSLRGNGEDGAGQ
jgi:crotonobetainyl-CoA:carnitine CoA-transferase CaiB-like acyl-CoA transferase